MIQLPYRDFETGSIGGGAIKRQRKPWVYKSEYDKMARERDLWRQGFKGVTIFAIGLLLTQIFGDRIIELILR